MKPPISFSTKIVQDLDTGKWHLEPDLPYKIKEPKEKVVIENCTFVNLNPDQIITYTVDDKGET
jgi:hypothetical protein